MADLNVKQCDVENKVGVQPSPNKITNGSSNTNTPQICLSSEQMNNNLVTSDIVQNHKKSEWIKLNVGGQVFTTTRTTLCKDPGSLLAKLVNENMGNLVTDGKDEDGAILIDRDGSYFTPILNFLRHGKLLINKDLIEEGVLEEAEFYNVTEVIQLVKERIRLRDNDRHQRHNGGKQHTYRVLQCQENELVQLISTMSDGWAFEQVINVGSQYSYGSDDHAEFLCVVSREYSAPGATLPLQNAPPPPPLPQQRVRHF